MVPIVIVSAVAMVGIVIAFAAASLVPTAGVTGRAGPAAERLREPSIRERLSLPFATFVERSNRQRRLNGGLTLAEHLARADIKLLPPEFVMIQIGFVCAGGLLALWRFGLGWQCIVLGGLAYFVPILYMKYRQRRRLAKLNSQLPITVGLLSNSLKAGLSLPQALDTVGRNSPRPIADELARVVREMNLGIAPAAALASMVRRVGSQDLDLVVTAVSIQMSVGGNLARLLDTIVLTIRQRIQVKARITVLTAQARTSGWVITLLPLCVVALLYIVAPTYFRPMVESALGIVMLVGAAIAILTGNFLIRRIVNFKV